MSDKERIYDEEIAPLLLQAAKIAHEHEIDLVAVVDIGEEADPYAVGVTRSINMSRAQASLRLVNLASYARGNVDQLMMALLRDVKGKSHNSIALNMLSRGGQLVEDAVFQKRTEALKKCLRGPYWDGRWLRPRRRRLRHFGSGGR